MSSCYVGGFATQEGLDMPSEKISIYTHCLIYQTSTETSADSGVEIM